MLNPLSNLFRRKGQTGFIFSGWKLSQICRNVSKAITHAGQSKQKPIRKSMGMLKRNSPHSKHHYTDPLHKPPAMAEQQPAAPWVVHTWRQNKAEGNVEQKSQSPSTWQLRSTVLSTQGTRMYPNHYKAWQTFHGTLLGLNLWLYFGSFFTGGSILSHVQKFSVKEHSAKSKRLSDNPGIMKSQGDPA